MGDNRMEININYGKHSDVIYGNKGTSIYRLLCENGIFTDAICGGNGSCGHCKIQVLKGRLAITSKDSMYFSQEELDKGFRLACMAYPQENCDIKILEKENYYGEETVSKTTNEYHRGEYGIAIDIGTTTIVYQLTELKTGEVFERFSEINSNRMYGADVLTRIDSANKGMLPDMSKQLRKQLRNGIKKIFSKILVEAICNEIVIAGNTTMIHILMGYSCENMGKFPFKPVTTKMLMLDSKQLGLTDIQKSITIIPGVSAFIGGDIVAGLSMLDFGQVGKKEFFLDLGTNGEMAVSDGVGHIYATSAPAGPAFEGGNISCGIGSVAGAIEACHITNNQINIETIDGLDPLGICGSGIIELLYELRKNHIIDETGLLSDIYFENGYPIYENLFLTQNDIRAIQMAKAAIAAGIEILLQTVNIKIEELDTFYISGSFGCHLNINKAIGIGLLDKELTTKIKLLGNTSISGANCFLCGTDKKLLTSIVNRTSELYLSNNSDYNVKYLEKMYLENIAEFD